MSQKYSKKSVQQQLMDPLENIQEIDFNEIDQLWNEFAFANQCEQQSQSIENSGIQNIQENKNIENSKNTFENKNIENNEETTILNENTQLKNNQKHENMNKTITVQQDETQTAEKEVHDDQQYKNDIDNLIQYNKPNNASIIDEQIQEQKKSTTKIEQIDELKDVAIIYEQIYEQKKVLVNVQQHSEETIEKIEKNNVDNESIVEQENEFKIKGNKKVIEIPNSETQIIKPETQKEREARIMEMVKSTQISTAARLCAVQIKLQPTQITPQGIVRTLTKGLMKPITVVKLKIPKSQFIDFNSAMGVMADKFYIAMQNQHVDEFYQPEVCDIDTITGEVVKCSQVVVALGMIESFGIPTLDSHEYMQLFTRYPNFHSMRDLTKQPRDSEYWDFYQSVQTLFSGLQGEKIHFALAKTLHRFNAEESKMFVVTDLVDGLLTKSAASLQPMKQQASLQASSNDQFEECKQTPLSDMVKGSIIEINGDIHSFNCETCKSKFKTSLQFAQAPKCTKCHSDGIPTLINEQSIDQVLGIIDRYTVLIMVGLNSSDQVRQIVEKCIQSDSLIVEVGLQPTLEVGRIKYIIGEPSEVFPLLCDNLTERFY